jgi:hypothetical protein
MNTLIGSIWIAGSIGWFVTCYYSLKSETVAMGYCALAIALMQIAVGISYMVLP